MKIRCSVFLLYSLFSGCFFSLPAQVIVNAYARVTAVSNSSVLTVSNVNQTNHTFTIGQKVIVMQMQDNVIGTNTGNNVNFGNLSAIGNAGIYEIRTILSRSPASGNPTSITLSQPLSNTYNTGTNSSVQIITFRNMGTNFTTTSHITGLAWNGNVGGVIGIEVDNDLTLNHRILADGIGFSGGAVSANADQTCVNSSYRLNDANKAYKGEGIYRSTSTTYNNGRAKILNGGGGGSENNAGGGGGGNYTAGGDGGLGYQCTGSNSGRGTGGVALGAFVSGTRIFMGGGGGGGQMNNSNGSNGGNGGGIVLIKANRLVSTTSCSGGLRISANGANAANAANDGAGGGGAGGTIVLEVNSFSLTFTCPLINSSSGGRGGNVTDGTVHGGGGGGGQGAVIYSVAQPTANVTTSVTNGGAGSDNSGGTISAGSGGGSNGGGIIGGGNTPLPVELLSFSAERENAGVRLNWSTASEKDNDYFTVERSPDGQEYTEAGKLDGGGSSRIYRQYTLLDRDPYPGISYYRLKQTDFSGDFQYSSLVSVYVNREQRFSVYPNPVEAGAPVFISLNGEQLSARVILSLYDHTGKEIISKTVDLSGQEENRLLLHEAGLPQGVYVIRVRDEYTGSSQKLIIR